jgi:hypothetical protein
MSTTENTDTETEQDADLLVQLDKLQELGAAELAAEEAAYQKERAASAEREAKHVARVAALKRDFEPRRAAIQREIEVKSAAAQYEKATADYAAKAEEADALVDKIGGALKELAAVYVEAAGAELARVQAGDGLRVLRRSLAQRGLLNGADPYIPAKRLAQGESGHAMAGAREIAIALGGDKIEKLLAELWRFEPRSSGTVYVQGKLVEGV